MDLLVHLFLALLDVLAQALEDEGVDVVVVLVLGLGRRRRFLGLCAFRGGNKHGQQCEQHDAMAILTFGFHCAIDIIFQIAKLYLFIGTESLCAEK